MTSNRADTPADEQFPIIDPDALREFLAMSRMPQGWQVGDIGAVVAVELTTSQAQFLAARGKRRFGLTGEAALRREIETVIAKDVKESRSEIALRFSPWLDLIQMAKISPDVLERLRKAVGGK